MFFGLTGCGTNSASNSKEATAENPMVLTLAHGLSESHTVHIAMLQFAEEVKQKTNGRIIIKYSLMDSWFRDRES